MWPRTIPAYQQYTLQYSEYTSLHCVCSLCGSRRRLQTRLEVDKEFARGTPEAECAALKEQVAAQRCERAQLEQRVHAAEEEAHARSEALGSRSTALAHVQREFARLLGELVKLCTRYTKLRILFVLVLMYCICSLYTVHFVQCTVLYTGTGFRTTVQSPLA